MNKYLFANWKMNPESEQKALELAKAIREGISQASFSPSQLTVAIFPPFPWLDKIREQLKNSFLALGAQNIFWEERGAYTGEVSPLMVKDLGCEYVLIGHSERKIYLKETPEMLNKKLSAALRANLKPVLFLNPPEDLGEATAYLQKLLQGNEVNIPNVVFVYEPPEAISTQGGKTPSPEKITKISSLIKEALKNISPSDLSSEMIVLLYGGSVNKENVRKFTTELGLDGAVVGSKSLDPEEFLAIIKNYVS